MSDYRVTEAGIRFLMGDAENTDITRILSTLSETIFENTAKAQAWKRVQEETYLLLADQLGFDRTSHDFFSLFTKYKRTDEQKTADLALIKKGVDLAQKVLTAPDIKNVAELKTFAEKEALGKTNHWMRWGGALLAVVAVAVFIVSVGLTAGGTAAAAGFIAPSIMLVAAGGGISFFGKQKGLAKAGIEIAEKAEVDLKNPTSSS